MILRSIRIFEPWFQVHYWGFQPIDVMNAVRRFGTIGFCDVRRKMKIDGPSLVLKSTDSYVTVKSWCTSGIHHHERPNVNADEEFLQMGH